MTAPANVTDVLAELLGDAGRASAADDGARLWDRLAGAADLLVRLYEHLPHALPDVLTDLAVAPDVAGADLASAAGMAADVVADQTGTRPVLLHPQAPTFLALACSLVDGADARRVAALLAVELGPWGIRRPAGLPLHQRLAECAGSCTAADLTAAGKVLHLHLDAVEAEADRWAELVALLGPTMTGTDGSVADAVAGLEDAQRARADELLAEMPRIVPVPGGARP